MIKKESLTGNKKNKKKKEKVNIIESKLNKLQISMKLLFF